MQIAVEGHPRIESVTQGMEVIQEKPLVLPQPLLKGDCDADAAGVTIYGSVVREGGVFRMWYQALPDLNGDDLNLVGYAESDDGLAWRKVPLGLIEVCGSKQNNITDLPFHCPSVFIDPTAPKDMRYRATGFTHKEWTEKRFPHRINRHGYFSAHSADGIRWTLDSREPKWEWWDVITSTWDPFAGHAITMLKRQRYFRNIVRRAFWCAEWTGEGSSEPKPALLPDEYDDVIAQARGFNSADYYGVSLMPTEGPIIGILWVFRHTLPLTEGVNRGIFGRLDLSLVYQTERGARWTFLAGRPDWLSATEAPDWARGGLHTASYPIDVGDETWLYFAGGPQGHGWLLDNTWKIDPAKKALGEKEARRCIGLLKWRKNRLIGYRAPLQENLHLSPRMRAGDGKLILNVKVRPDGNMRVALINPAEQKEYDGYGMEDCDVITGDHQEITVTWKGKSALPRYRGLNKIFASLEMTRSTLYAFDFDLAP